MLELRATNTESIQALLNGLQQELEEKIQNPNVVMAVQQAVETTGHIVTDVLAAKELNSSNAVLIVSGKSSQISEDLISKASAQSSNADFDSLVASMMRLDDVENAGLYAGEIPRQIQDAMDEGKYLIFLDEYSKTYNKAISFLSTFQKKKYDRVKFIVFAGERVKSSFPAPELLSKISKGSADPQVVDFLEVLSRLQSELLRDGKDDSLRSTFQVVGSQIRETLQIVRE